MKNSDSKGRSASSLTMSVNELDGNKGGNMKDLLTFKEEILSISKELDLLPETVEDIAMDLLKEKVLEEKHEREISDCIAGLFTGIDGYDDGEYESVSSILSNSIFNQDTDEGIKKIVARERAVLNEGSADVEDFNSLRKQAEAYFKNPTRYPLKENSQREDWVVGYVSVYAYSELGKNGISRDVFKSTGDIIHIPAGKANDVVAIRDELKAIGYQLNNLVQIKFYGAALNDLIGNTSYREDETAKLVSLLSNYPNILYAIPDESALGDDSIYSSLNRIVQEEVIYGRVASEVLGDAFAHWSLCREFYEVRLPEIEEEKKDELSSAKVVSLMDKRQQFKNGFSLEVEIIKQLNNGGLTINDLSSKSDHEVNRILWVCKSKDFSCKIESKPVFLQIQALARKLKHSSNQPVTSNEPPKAIELINFINEGGDIFSIEISDELLTSVFALLWDRNSNARIKPEYKATYFELKKRFTHINKRDDQGKSKERRIVA